MPPDNPIIEVDRVASVEEAVAFRDAGATLIGVALDPDPRFGDTRFVSPSIAKAIQDAIAPACLVGVLPTYFYHPEKAEARARTERMLALKPDFLHFYRGGLTDELVPLVQAASVSVIRDGAILDADQGVFLDRSDPASFVKKQIEDGAKLSLALCHLDVLTDMAVDPWVFLNSTALEWPKDMPQVADIAATCRFFSALWKWAQIPSTPMSRPSLRRAASSAGSARVRRAAHLARGLNHCWPPSRR